MIVVRWIGTPWALLQVILYEQPYPPGARVLALSLVCLLATVNTLIYLLHRGPNGVERARWLAMVGLALDIFVVSSFVWLYAFDPSSALWAVLFILTLEGAVSFQLRGALTAWGAVTAIYTMREIWGSNRYDYPLEWNSITFRMGIAGIIAVVGGMMARDLVRQRTQLRQTLTDLQRVDRLRLGLITTLGHDVRSPLTVIRGGISTLLSKGDKVDPETAKMLLEASDRQARRLEMLANDLLDMARLESGRLEMHLADVQLAPAVEQILSYLEGGQKAHIALDIQPVTRVRADSHRLEQVLYNLISNALRHGKPPVIVAATPWRGSIRIDVTDSGSGVPEDEQPYLFEAFRSESASGSVGYGLAIVKALIEAHEGTVWYENAHPSGARFSFLLPAGQDVAEEPVVSGDSVPSR